MKAIRSALLCAAIAGALSSSAAEPVLTVRVRSLGAALAVVRDASALAGQPFAAVMAESALRSQIAQTGLEIREDDPVLLAIAPNPAAKADSGEAGMVGLMADPPAMAVALPSAPFPAGLLENLLDTTNAPAPGEWAANADGSLSYAYRGDCALVALKEKGRALAESLAASKPARPDAILELTISEPAEFQKSMELGDAKEEVLSAAFDEIADKLGLPGFGDRIKVLVDAAEKVDRETESCVVDVWFDATNGLAVAATRVAREGSDFAARIAAAPALDPAALPGVPAGAPLWAVQASAESPDGDAKALFGAIRALVDGPAPSGDAAATAQRAAAVRVIDANLAALPAVGATALYATADSEGRPAFAADTRLRDAAPARALLDAQAAFFESFPALASNGVAVVRESPRALRIDVSTADAFVGVARLGYELAKLDEEDDGSDLWVDEEDGDDDDDEEDWDDDEEKKDDADEEKKDDGCGNDDCDADDCGGDCGDDCDPDDCDAEFDEAEAREIAKQLADAIGETIAIRDEIAEDGTSEKVVASAPGAKLPPAQGVPDLARALALGKAFLPAGAKPFAAGAFSFRAAVAAYLPAVVRLSEAAGDPMDAECRAKAEKIAAGDADFGFRFLSATEGRSTFDVFVVPRADIEALAKLLVEAQAASGDDASFDEDGEDEKNDEDEDLPAAS